MTETGSRYCLVLGLVLLWACSYGDGMEGEHAHTTGSMRTMVNLSGPTVHLSGSYVYVSSTYVR